MSLSGSLHRTEGLSSTSRDEMALLMQRHYDNVCPADFESDLAVKRWVIQLRCQSTGKLCGFSTQTVLDALVDGRAVKALFSGDTIIDRDWWGDPALMQVTGRLMLSLIDEHPGTELYWFLISAGYKTYRFLPLCFHEFYPSYDRPTPEGFQAVIDALSRQKYPDRYDVESGIIRATRNQYRLRPGVADVTPERLRDLHVKFFVERNPGHVSGDELCCLAPLTRENFTRAARRVIAMPEAWYGVTSRAK